MEYCSSERKGANLDGHLMNEGTKELSYTKAVCPSRTLLQVVIAMRGYAENSRDMTAVLTKLLKLIIILKALTIS